MAQPLAGDWPIDAPTTDGIELADILNRFQQSVSSSNSGASAPPSTYPGMIWLDTSGGGEGVLKIRNAGNTGWITLNTPGGPSLLADGTPAKPGLAWTNEPGLGWLRAGGGQISFVSGGVGVWGRTITATDSYEKLSAKSVGGRAVFSVANAPGGSPNYNQLDFAVNADGNFQIGGNRVGTAGDKSLTLSGFGTGVFILHPLYVSGNTIIQANTGALRFGTAGGAIELHAENPYPSLMFSASGGYKIIHVRASGDLVYQSGSSTNLMTIYGNGVGVNFVGAVGCVGNFTTTTGAFRTSGDSGLVFDVGKNTQYVALGDPAYGSQFQIAFMHVPGTWAGVRFLVQSAQYQFTDNGQARATVAGPWAALVSDARVKDITGDYTDGLDEVLALRPRRFRFKAETGLDPSIEHINLIAQEAQETMPVLVGDATVSKLGSIELDDMLTLDIGPITFALVNAVKTLHQRLTAVEGA